MTMVEETADPHSASTVKGKAPELAKHLRQLASADYSDVGDRTFEAAHLLDAQHEAISRVRSLHAAVPVQFESYSVCSACITQAWPCATISALGGFDDSMSEAPRSVPSRG